MLAGTRHHTRARRGIVLVLVLAMLGLLALLGVTFATFSGQARINARNFAQSVVRAQSDELMDFALQQLITDTADARSVIRGHSLARDMFGNDAPNNGYLTANPYTGGPVLINNVYPVKVNNILVGYDIQTNLPTPSQQSVMYGYDFTRWTMRVNYIGTFVPGNPYPVSQTAEILIDDYGQAGVNTQGHTSGLHTFRIALPDPAMGTYYMPANGMIQPAGTIPSTGLMPNPYTVLNNPTLGYITTSTEFPGWSTTASNATPLALNNYFNGGGNVALVLDGRWLHAFNGQGMGALSVGITTQSTGTSAFVPLSTYGNFRYNGWLLQSAAASLNLGAATPLLNGPSALGMDEDYDACDLENWFLAIQSADGQVIIPSFHRPAIIRYDPNNPTPALQANDWGSTSSGINFRTLQGVDSMARILRPVAADGHDATTFPDLTPDPNTGKITYDVDNDGDGVTDSVWLDLGYPARRDASGNIFKPLFAFMVIGLNGRIPLNTAGNLASSTGVNLASSSSTPAYSPGATGATSSTFITGAGQIHAAHLGNSVSEIDPQYGLQNAFNLNTDLDPFNQYLNNTLAGPGGNGVWAGPSSTATSGTNTTYNTQVDNAWNNVTGTANVGNYTTVDVRLTQLRNLLAGTRPHVNPLQPNTSINGDVNYIYGSWPGQSSGGIPYAFPNSLADGADVSTTSSSFTDPNYPGVTLTEPLVQRLGAPVAGRWGEASMIPGVPFSSATGAAGSMVQAFYANPIRAGYSFDMFDLINNLSGNVVPYYNGYLYPFPRDSADDDNNAFDIYPVPNTTTSRFGEIYDQDFYDSAGALILPVERMRRFVTPMDINGTGAVLQWRRGAASGAAQVQQGLNRGADHFGRVQFYSYYRPPGVAAPLNISSASTTTYPYGTAAPLTSLTATGTQAPSGGFSSWDQTTGEPTLWTQGQAYVPDVTNNPLHGYEWYKVANATQAPGLSPTAAGGTAPYQYSSGTLGGMPIFVPGTGVAPVPLQQYQPTTLPTYGVGPNPSTGNGASGYGTNAIARTDGLNEADEMNLYTPNPLLDSSYGPSDLEWLYRQQDVDGASLTSRLAQLAPVSFTNTIDGLRRRRLYSTDSWESNSYVWAPDNPGGNFNNNSYFSAVPSTYVANPTNPLTSVDTSNASFTSLSGIRTFATGNSTVFVAPGVTQRGKKINLNFPLPVSNDPNEPIRQRWITDTYQVLKAILPPTSVDSPEELAQLSQYVINIIDFRDPDATMTHWRNPDVLIVPGSYNATTTTFINPTLISSQALPASIPPTAQAFDQYGMEFNPVAINETLAYAFQSRTGTAVSTATYNSRLFVELVNTLTAAFNPEYVGTGGPADDSGALPPVSDYYGPAQASSIDLSGFTYIANDPYAGGCWDLVFTADNAMSRPDPYRGDLLYNPNAAALLAPPTGLPNPIGFTTFGLIPLTRDALSTTTTAIAATYTSNPEGYDANLIPLNPTATSVIASTATGRNAMFVPPATQPSTPVAPAITTPPPLNYFWVVGTMPGTTTSTSAGGGTLYNEGGTPLMIQQTGLSPVTQYFQPYFDPMNSGAAAPLLTSWGDTFTAGANTYEAGPGILPGATTAGPPSTFWWTLPNYTAAGATSATSIKLGGYLSPSTGPAPLTTGSGAYFWVCLRRPANPFAPVSALNPMVVVDSMRFPFVDGTAAPGTSWTGTGPYTPNPATGGTAGSTGNTNTIFSAQRLQPYRGGHAVPMPHAIASTVVSPLGAAMTTMPPDPRYGYSEQTAVPQSAGANYSGSAGGPGGTTTQFTYGLANNPNKSATIPSTCLFYHTLGYYNDSAEYWDYFPFNDRDFSSVAELLLVPGCPPGLFTKQFGEFAPSQTTAVNVFSQVQPVITPTFLSTYSSTTPTGITTGASLYATAWGGASTSSPLNNWTIPYLSGTALAAANNVTAATTVATWGASNVASNLVQPAAYTSNSPMPHAFPYLVDRFFYTGASSFLYPPAGNPTNQPYGNTNIPFIAMDPGSVNFNGTYGEPSVPVVGGPGGDGWFKMLEFFEVPSQATGSIGTVAQGANFDWARQDTKPGLMNLNLIIDEEAFYSVFGSQTVNSGYNQALLNSIELPLLSYPNAAGQLTVPYNLPLSNNNYLNSPFHQTTGVGFPPIPSNGPPVPLVVSASQVYGAPSYVYPITDQTQYLQHGYLAGNDPITYALLPSVGVIGPAPGNRIKAAFAQFLWSRHGGSGYIFGYGTGVTGSNSAVSTPSLTTYNNAIPAEMPFHALSYPDIDYTIMRPAAPRPSTLSNPYMLSGSTPASNALGVQWSQSPPATVPINAPGTTTPSWYMLSNTTVGEQPYYYAPYVAFAGTPSPVNTYPANTPIVYSGDPGVRNPYFNPGYVTSGISPTPAYPATPTILPQYSPPPHLVYLATVEPSGTLGVNVVTNTTGTGTIVYAVPPGMPLPQNVAFPSAAGGTTVPTGAGVMMPPPIPPARLFQIPDYFGAGLLQSTGYTGIIDTGAGNLPPAVSNASDSGDPWINNFVANQFQNPWLSAGMTNYPSSYSLSNGFVSLPWSGGSAYNNSGATIPMLTPTGVLPPVSVFYPPYSTVLGTTPNYTLTNGLTAYNGYGSVPGKTTLTGPYLGANFSPPSGPTTNMDHREHPYWRTEMLQKAMNLTTVRTHQYAVWITIGFFEVTRQGDLGMLAQASIQFSAGNTALAVTNLQMAFDILGPEIGALDGQNTRYRGFFIVDRLKLTGFNHADVGAFHSAIVYRKVIQ